MRLCPFLSKISKIGLVERMLNDTIKLTIKDAAKKLTGNQKRDFIAKVAEDYCNSSARKAETVFGWCRHSVQLGLHERRTGIICVDNYRARGRHKSEEKLPNLKEDILSLVDVQAQADPKFQSTFLYARISAASSKRSTL